ncbi:hypothetical protein PCC8801_0189 [Rippkaea orientalis PCC 8801]|uniref:Uncharacterized protein n=1 Tax=Rippkaea orientalis (strain PCC 8801 / RF-1) TaxID=41431 RepID=B7K1Y6_RIPO1|nr:hypothetical protein [Rippkaea orientalis]ACK64293.1 hypothetical protein PCC8801_0189 [Rippkaea orientalis PCC 8801]
MAKPTQAHLSRTLKRNEYPAIKQRTKDQMEYYMGAKLIEVGVNPKSAIYRWSLEIKNNQETWTYSAYWGESKDKLLSGEMPLTGTELIDCARANAKQGLQTTAQLCGYQTDINKFQEALQEAGKQAGITIDALGDLLSESKNVRGRSGGEVAPDSSSSL